MKEKYNSYLFNCHTQGDIWFEYYRPYSFDEWFELGCPENGGKEI